MGMGTGTGMGMGKGREMGFGDEDRNGDGNRDGIFTSQGGQTVSAQGRLPRRSAGSVCGQGGRGTDRSPGMWVTPRTAPAPLCGGNGKPARAFLWGITDGSTGAAVSGRDGSERNSGVTPRQGWTGGGIWGWQRWVTLRMGIMRGVVGGGGTRDSSSRGVKILGHVGVGMWHCPTHRGSVPGSPHLSLPPGDSAGRREGSAPGRVRRRRRVRGIAPIPREPQARRSLRMRGGAVP